MRGPASLPSRRVSLCPSRAPRPPVNVPRPSQPAVRLRRALGSTPSRQVRGPASPPGDTRASTRALGGHSTSVGHAPSREVSRVTAMGSSERGHPSSQHRACPQRTGRAGQREQGVKAGPFSATERSGCGRSGEQCPPSRSRPFMAMMCKGNKGRHRGGESMEGVLEEASGVRGGALGGGYAGGPGLPDLDPA